MNMHAREIDPMSIHEYDHNWMPVILKTIMSKYLHALMIIISHEYVCLVHLLLYTYLDWSMGEIPSLIRFLNSSHEQLGQACAMVSWDCKVFHHDIVSGTRYKQ